MSDFTIERIYLPSIDESNAINAALDSSNCGVTRDDMVGFYEECIIADNLAWQRNKRAEEDGERLEKRVDFKAVNDAILARWSPSGLTYIKEKAWKAFAAKCSDGPNARSEYA